MTNYNCPVKATRNLDFHKMQAYTS